MATTILPSWPRIDQPERLRIYELERPTVSERAVRQLAAGLDLPLEARKGRLEQDDTKLRYSTGSHEVTLYRASGALRYKDLGRWQVDDGRSNVSIADEQAADAARRYMDAHRVAPLDECELAAVTRLRVGVTDLRGQESEERVIDVGVVFRRLVEGTPVDGPGGKVIVYLDAEGEVTGVDRTWRGIRRALRNVEAVRSAEQVNAGTRRYWGARARIEVSEIRFGYFEQGPHTAQRTLQPAYVVMATVWAGEARPTRQGVYVLAAATNAVGTLQPPRPRLRPQLSRPEPDRGGRSGT